MSKQHSSHRLSEQLSNMRTIESSSRHNRYRHNKHMAQPPLPADAHTQADWGAMDGVEVAQNGEFTRYLQDMDIFIRQLNDVTPLPITKQGSCDFQVLDPELQLTIRVPAQIDPIIGKAKEEYENASSNFFKSIATLQNDVQLLREGKTPKTVERKTQLQFRKEQDNLKKQFEGTGKVRSLQDLRLKIDANRAWIAEQSNYLQPRLSCMTYFTQRLELETSTSRPRGASIQ
eukprot:TRINITY_DN36251_c0_g1_i2.p2 TRINITY_DN36251_c0_g1~~TRINITY_DN36251_c0_g1_i2.p2  ORF type:complete len:231 (-),score=52.11 TRINITY_DN36251_c0_g1_i2:1456-2148(-)